MEQAAQFINIRRWKSGRWEDVETGVIAEKPVSLTVNGELWLTFMCTPVDLEYLGIGFLYNENVIQSFSDIASIRVCPTRDNIDIWLNHSPEHPQNWRRTTGCTGGITSIDLSNIAQVTPHQDGVVLTPFTILHLIQQLFESQRLYRLVGGVHTSILSDGNEVLAAAEDIGRHNTLDKLAGYCLLQGMASPRRVLITTGRISSEMLQKAARMEVSVVISRTSPSSLSIDLADRWGITLIGYARRDCFNIYTHPERVISVSAYQNTLIPGKALGT